MFDMTAAISWGIKNSGSILEEIVEFIYLFNYYR